MPDLARLQQLAEAVGWEIWEIGSGYTLTIAELMYNYNSLTPIRERLEQEYRKLAEQARNIKKVLGRGEVTQGIINELERIADELAVKEPTIVEPTILQRLKQKREGKHDPFGQHIILDALIDLYERKEK